MRLGGEGRAALSLRDRLLGANGTSPLHTQDAAMSQRQINPPLGFIRSRFHSTQHCELNKPELKKDSVNNRQMPSCGQGDRPSVPQPPFPWPVPPPAGAQVGAQGLHLSEAPAPASFPRTQGPQGRGQGGAAAERRELEPKKLGPELGVSGTAPTASILSNCLTTGQNLWADFYFRK